MSGTDQTGADTPAPDEHDAVEARFSDYHEEVLPASEAEEVRRHLADCERCRAAYDDFRETVGALSGLHRMAAPDRFEAQVEETIRRRSGGRFFGRKAFGDRVPFEVLAVLAIVVGLLVYYMVYSSNTGSLKYEPRPAVPDIAPGATEVMPRP
jgi:predicted anti-sigma-YlaC factor YlaD